MLFNVLGQCFRSYLAVLVLKSLDSKTVMLTLCGFHCELETLLMQSFLLGVAPAAGSSVITPTLT